MRVLRRFWRERFVEIVLLYGVVQLLAIAAGGWLTTHRWWTVVFAGVLIAAVVGTLEVAERRRTQIVEGTEFSPRRGVVVTVSLKTYDDSVCRLVVEEQRGVEAVGLLATAQVQSQYLAGYQAAIATRGLAAHVAICDATDLVDIVARAGSLLDWMGSRGLAFDDMAVDITQGTVPMSVGAYVVAAERGVACQYVASKVEGTDRRVVTIEHGPQG